MRQSRCFYLPPELWARIFTYMSPIDLWVTCRQVSRAMRAEAEREFARNRLKDLTVSAHALGSFPNLREDIDYYCRLLTTGLLQLSTDDERATYHAKIASFPRFEHQSVTEVSLTKNMLFEAVSNSDLHFHRRIHSYEDSQEYAPNPRMSQSIELGPYIIDAPILALDIDYDQMQVSFKWKPLLSEMFGWYENAQRLYGHQLSGLYGSAKDRAELHQGLSGPSSQWTFLSKIRTAELRAPGSIACLERAYICRLRRAHAISGVMPAVDEDSQKDSIETMAPKIQRYLKRMLNRGGEQLYLDFVGP